MFSFVVGSDFFMFLKVYDFMLYYQKYSTIRRNCNKYGIIFLYKKADEGRESWL